MESVNRTPTVDEMSCRNVCRRVLIFSWKVLINRGKADTMSASAKPCLHGFWRTWMVRVGDPVMMRTAVSLFTRKFTPGDATSRRDIPFAVGVRGVYGNLRYEPCFQFINVSQRAVHIYELTAVECVRWTHRTKSKTKTATCEQALGSLFPFWLCMARNFPFTML